MANKIKGITIEIAGETTKLQSALKDVNKQSRDLASELRQVERGLRFNPKDTELLAQKQKLLGDQVATTRERLDRLKEAEKQVQEQFERGEIKEEQYRAFKREVIETESKLKNYEKQLQAVTREQSSFGKALQEAGGKLKEVGKKLTDVGKSLSLKVTAPIVGAGTAAVKMASDFEDSLAKVSTLADETQTSMTDLRAGILDISSATGIAATEISGSVYDALSAGVETAEVLEYVEANVQLTKAGFTDMGTAIDATSTVLNAYRDAAFDVAKIGDILVKTQDEGKISVDELGKNMGRVIPTASSLGVNLDQLGAAYAIMTAKGQNASIATTNMNSMLGELGKTGSKSDKALREMTGKSFKEIVESGSSVGDVLGLLDEHAKNAGLSLSDMFGSTTAGSAALTLLSGGVDAFNSKVDIMNNSTGTMAANVEKLLTPSEKMSIALNKVKNAGIKMGTAILPVLETLSRAIEKVANWLGNMDESTRKNVVIIAGLVAAIGPLLVVLGPLISTIGSLIMGLGAMSTAMTAGAGVMGGLTAGFPALGAAITVLTGPIGITVAAIAGLAIGITALVKHLKRDAIPAVNIFSDEVSSSTQEVVGAYMDLDDKATKSLNSLAWGQQEITEEMAGQLIETYGTMNGKILESMEQRQVEEMAQLKELFATTSALTGEEQAEALTRLEQHQNAERISVEAGQKEIENILRTAAEEKRSITEEEHKKISLIQERMKKDAIRVMSESEAEQKAIFEGLRREAEKITALQAADVAKNAIEQKNKVIEEAEAQYKESIAAIIRQRDEAGTISEEQAEKLIAEAQRQRDDTISAAEEMHQKIVTEAEAQAGEHARWVDWETGEVLSKWEKFKIDVLDTWENIKKGLSDIWENIKKVARETWDGIKDTIKGTINGITEMINKWIRWLNNIKIKVPTITIPFVGTFGGWEIGLPTIPEIPRLAAGGIVTQQMLAMVGEKGAEAVIPLDRIDGIIAKALEKANMAGGDTIINVYNPQPSPSELARQIKRAQQDLALGF